MVELENYLMKQKKKLVLNIEVKYLVMKQKKNYQTLEKV